MIYNLGFGHGETRPRGSGQQAGQPLSLLFSVTIHQQYPYVTRVRGCTVHYLREGYVYLY